MPGGIGNHAYQLANFLYINGLNVAVVTDHRNRESEFEEKQFNLQIPYQIIRIRRYKMVWLTYINRIIKSLLTIKSFSPTHVIASGRFQLWLSAGLSFVFPHRYYLAVIHGSELRIGNKRAQWLTRYSLGKFKQLITVSHFTRSLLPQLPPTVSVTVVHNGFAPLPSSTSDKIPRIVGFPALITVGNVTFRKGQQNVIQSLQAIRKVYPNVHYHIVGIPTEQAAFFELARQLEVEDCITFHGAISNERLSALLLGSDIFLMLSEHLSNGDVEGFGIAILEANYFGLPAIGSNDSGIAEAIGDGYSGRLVFPNDPENVLSAIQDVLTNYQFYQQNAKKWSDKFKWEKVIKQYIDLL